MSVPIISTEHSDRFHQNLTLTRVLQDFTPPIQLLLQFSGQVKHRPISLVLFKYCGLFRPPSQSSLPPAPAGVATISAAVRFLQSQQCRTQVSWDFLTWESFWINSCIQGRTGTHKIPAFIYSMGLISEGTNSHESLRKYQHWDLSTHSINGNPPFC